MKLAPISIEEARDYFERHSAFRGEFNLAIAAAEDGKVHGVIAMRADGAEFALGHISTDGSAHIGSLLYGGAWRVAKALGYEMIRI